MRISWQVHVQSMDDHRMPKKILNEEVYSSKVRERPRKRRIRDVDEDVRTVIIQGWREWGHKIDTSGAGLRRGQDPHWTAAPHWWRRRRRWWLSRSQEWLLLLSHHDSSLFQVLCKVIWLWKTDLKQGMNIINFRVLVLKREWRVHTRILASLFAAVIKTVHIWL